MRRAILTILLVVVSGSATAVLPLREGELTAIDFENAWRPVSDTTFPKEAVRAFPQYAQDDNSPLDFLWIDLDGDGQDEILVGIRSFGSGGKEYFILRRSGKSWRLIGEFQGGFVLSLLDSKNSFYRITSYYKSGDTYQNTYDYRQWKYRLTGQVLIPRVITHSCWWSVFWPRLNGVVSNARNSKKCASSDELAPSRR